MISTESFSPLRPRGASSAPFTADSMSNWQGRLSLRRFTVGEYHQLIRDGYFAHDERFELLDGLIIQKMPKNPIHEAAVAQARKIFEKHLPPGFHIRVGGPMTLSSSEPEPDLCIVRGDELDYATHHPGQAEVLVVVEVSNSTLSDDRKIKGPLYAADHINNYWILNLVDWRLEAYSDPTGPDSLPTFRRRTDYTPEQAVIIELSGPSCSIPVAELLPEKLRSIPTMP